MKGRGAAVGGMSGGKLRDKVQKRRLHKHFKNEVSYRRGKNITII